MLPLQRTIGIALVLVAFLVLASAPGKFSTGHLYTFLFCFVFGWLLLFRVIRPSFGNFTGEPSPRAMSRPLVSVPTQSFRYAPVGPGVWMLFICLSLIGLVCATILALGFRTHPLAERILGPAPLILFSIGLPSWLWYSQRQSLQVDDIGLCLHKWPRKLEIRWHEIVALRTHSLSTSGVSSLYYEVYAPRQKIVFTNRLPDVGHLTALIAQATGLAWN
jgi:hypothetical protein